MRERRRAALNSLCSPLSPLFRLSRPRLVLLSLSPLLSLLSPPTPLPSPSSLMFSLLCNPPPLYPPLNRITRLFVPNINHHSPLFQTPITNHHLICFSQTQQMNETHYQASLTSSLPPTDPLRRLLSPRLPSLSRRLINRMLRCAPWRISRPPKLRPPLPPLLRVMHRSSRNGGIFWPTPHTPAPPAPLSSSRS